MQKYAQRMNWEGQGVGILKNIRRRIMPEKEHRESSLSCILPLSFTWQVRFLWIQFQKCKRREKKKGRLKGHICCKSLQRQKSFTSHSHFNPLFQHQTLTSASISDPFTDRRGPISPISVCVSLSLFLSPSVSHAWWHIWLLKGGLFCKPRTSLVFFL